VPAEREKEGEREREREREREGKRERFAYIFPFVRVTNLIKAVMDFQTAQKCNLADSIGNRIEHVTGPRGGAALRRENAPNATSKTIPRRATIIS